MTGITLQKQVTNLLNSNKKIIDELISAWCPSQFREDYKQDFFLSIYEMTDEKMQIYINNNAFIYLCISIIKNHLKSKTSSFYRTYIRQNNIEKETKIKINNTIIQTNITNNVEDDYIICEKQFNERKYINNILNDELAKNKKFIIEKYLFEKYIYDNKTMRELEKETKICLSSVHKYINRAKNIIEKNKKV